MPDTKDFTPTPIYNNPHNEKLIEETLIGVQGLFKPTYLYVKKHSKTGLLYFGKTCLPDPIKYKGSGKRWTNHLKIHGREFVETIFLQYFLDIKDCVRYAITFSFENDIVNSKLWANLVPESGIDCSSKGVVVMDKNGKKFKVDKNNDRYLTGELVGHTKGKTTMKDKSGIFVQVSSDDPRIKSGELFGPNYGMSGSNNYNAKTWILTSPLGEVNIINGELLSFCESMNLSLTVLRPCINKGKVPPLNPRTGYKLKDRRNNTTGWSLFIYTQN